MSQIHLRDYPHGYRLPLRNILLLTCIDLRLMDEIVHFMEHDNLTNRYDQFSLAGASLITQLDTYKNDFDPGQIEPFTNSNHWKATFEDHIELAIALHQIQDVYIVEHRNCGAYEKFLKDGRHHADTEQSEREYHYKYSKSLCKQIRKKYGLNAHSFLMDLRGNPELLYSTTGKEANKGGNKPSHKSS